MNELTVPLIVAGGLGAIVTLAIWLFHIIAVNNCRKELSGYKEQVITLSDKVDALKERHRALPHLDRDFTVPMSGETLAAYNEVAKRLDHHRQEWLRLMEAWEQAQAALDAEWFLGNKRAREASRSLQAAAAPAALAAVLNECETPLDRIEHAHAQAVTDLQSYQQEDRTLGMLLESLAGCALAITPYQPDRTAAADLVSESQGTLPADPLATLRLLADARRKLETVQNRAAMILEHAATARELASKLSELQQITAQYRAQGFLLQEEGANPDPHLSEVARQHTIAQAALNQADEKTAGVILSDAGSLLEQARQGMQAHVAAKQRCETEIPLRQAEARRLADAQALARAQHAELSRDFAAETWLGVADNVQRSQAGLEAADQITAEAARQAASHVQHFLLAGKLLDQAIDSHRHAQAELASIGSRLRELTELRSTFQGQIGHLTNRSERVRSLLQSNTADRAAVNERYRAVRATLDSLVQDSREQRPDWTRLTSRLRGIDGDLDRVEQLAREDIQLAQQSVAEIAETERVIRDARAFQQGGITADVSAAESQLAQARGSLTAQGYEEAIRLANAAEQMARAAHNDAIYRAQRRQQEEEARRRAQEAATVPCTLAPSKSMDVPCEALDPAFQLRPELESNLQA